MFILISNGYVLLLNVYVLISNVYVLISDVYVLLVVHVIEFASLHQHWPKLQWEVA